jgi:hypothetical protein
MKHISEPLWAAAGGWAIAQASGAAQLLAEAAPELGPIRDAGATAILGGLLWYVVRDLKSAVERNTAATQDLQGVVGELRNLFRYGSGGKIGPGDGPR